MGELYQKQVDRLDARIDEVRYQIEALLNTEDSLVAEREKWVARIAIQTSLTLIIGGENSR